MPEVYGWQLRDDDEALCSSCGARQRLLYRRRRLAPGGWEDQDERLCFRCMGERMALRSDGDRDDARDSGRSQ